MPFGEEKLLRNTKSESLFGYVQCDIEAPENLSEAFANFPLTFKNIIVGRDIIRPFIKEYAEKEGLLKQPRKMLISSQFLENGTTITPLLLCYLDLVLVCKKVYRFVQYTPTKCFNNFVQPAMNARRQRDENPNSIIVAATMEFLAIIVAATMKFLANSSYGYQIMDGSRHTVTKYLSDEKKHGAINNKKFKGLGYINDQLYEVELVKSEIEHEEPIILGYFSVNLQNWECILTRAVL